MYFRSNRKPNNRRVRRQLRGLNPFLAMLRLLRARRGSSANSHLAQHAGRPGQFREVNPFWPGRFSDAKPGILRIVHLTCSTVVSREHSKRRGVPGMTGHRYSTAPDPVHRKSIAGAVVLT